MQPAPIHRPGVLGVQSMDRTQSHPSRDTVRSTPRGIREQVVTYVCRFTELTRYPGSDSLVSDVIDVMLASPEFCIELYREAERLRNERDAGVRGDHRVGEPMTENRTIAPGVWTRLPNGIEVMQNQVQDVMGPDRAVCLIAADGTVTLSAGTTWHVRA